MSLLFQDSQNNQSSPRKSPSCLDRDKRILTTLEDYGPLETEQIRLLLFRHGFKNTESGRRKTQERLLALYRREKVHRWAADAPLTKPAYIYSLEAKKGRDAHRLDVNWVRLWFTLPARRWRYHKVYNFHYEQDFGFLRADGLVGLNNYVTKKNLFFFVEMDRSPRNVFDKVPKYTRLMEEKGYGDRSY